MVSGKNFFSKNLQAFKGKTKERPQQEESGHADSHNAMSNSGDGSYVRIIDDGDGKIAVLLEVEHDKVLELGDRLGEINEAAYMNGYNWDALIRHYLKNNAPDILEAMDTDPEAGLYDAYFKESDANRDKAKRLADMLTSLINNEQELCRIVREEGDKINWG